MSNSVKLNLAQYKRALSDDLLLKAKTMYMEFVSISDIGRILDIKRTTIQYYVGKGWKSERDVLSSEFISNITSSRAEDLASLQASSIKTLKRCLKNLSDRDNPPSTKEAVDVMKILESMDKLAKTSPDEYRSFNGDSEEEVIDLDTVKDPFAILTNTKNGEEDEDSKEIN